MEISISDAGDIARQRLNNYIDEKFKGIWDDTTTWEFFTYLLEQAQRHEPDNSGYGAFEYQKDRDEARAICRKREEERYKEDKTRLPARSAGRRK